MAIGIDEGMQRVLFEMFIVVLTGGIGYCIGFVINLLTNKKEMNEILIKIVMGLCMIAATFYVCKSQLYENSRQPSSSDQVTYTEREINELGYFRDENGQWYSGDGSVTGLTDDDLIQILQQQQ